MDGEIKYKYFLFWITLILYSEHVGDSDRE